MPPKKTTKKTAGKAVPSSPEMSSGKRWLFRIAALLVAPVVLLGLVEGSLRLAGYGYSTSFWERTQIAGKDYFINNEDFSLRFFPPQLARWAHPVRITANKPANTCRVFIMGESAAQGDPEPAFGAGRYLEVLLRERYPTVSFEIANVAFTAINSHVILPIARECAGHEGDLWIVYMGNNEMVGPYGAATVFGLKAPPLGLVRASLALQRLRLGQWLMNLARHAKSGNAATSWAGMEMFVGNQLPATDPSREVVYRNFEANLRDIVKCGVDSGAKVLLNTVAVNLKDCPPFASLPNPQVAAPSADTCDQRYSKGTNAQAQGLFAEAAADFEQAAALDPSRANLQYRWAECLTALSNSAAISHFQSACDCDALPFRADSRLNGIIRQTAGKLAASNLVLCDSAADFSSLPVAANPFYEHVHFNFAGSYRLARIWAMEAEKSLAGKLPKPASSEWASQEICERRLGLTDQYRCAIVDGVIGRMRQPPLSSQMNNSARMFALENEVRRWRQGMGPDAPAQAREICTDAITRSPDDYVLREIYGAVLQGMGDFKTAAEQWRVASELMPRDRFAFLSEGEALERTGELESARTALGHAAALYPRWVDPWMELGKIDFVENKQDAAIANYQRALKIEPENPRVCFFMGKAVAKQGKSGESMEWYRRALKMKPDFGDAHFALGSELGLQGDIAAAKTEFEETVRLQPGYVPGHLNLGVSLLKLNQPEAARAQFTEALRLDPNNKFAQQYLTEAEAAPRSKP